MEAGAMRALDGVLHLLLPWEEVVEEELASRDLFELRNSCGFVWRGLCFLLHDSTLWMPPVSIGLV